MQIRILLGRPIGKQDTVAAQRVVVVNEVFAKRFFSNRNPVGRGFVFDGEKPDSTAKSSALRRTAYTPP